MFEIRKPGCGYYIKEMIGSAKFLHSDGAIYCTIEYFPTEVDAQAVLDKFYPKPEHVWENGDVFASSVSCGHMIYHRYRCSDKKDQVISLSINVGGPATNMDECMKSAKFLFNIKEKI